MPTFSKNGDIELAVLINGEKTNQFPKKEDGYTIEKIECDHGASAIWDAENWNITISQLNTSKTTCMLSFQSKFSKFLIDLSESDPSIEKMSHEETTQTGNNANSDYRYVGKNPNNYVCFGSDLESCPEENLYRIIGVIPTQSSTNGQYENRVKLIKATNWNSQYYWHNDGNVNVYVNNNYWENSTLKNTLNTQFWDSLGNYQKGISPAKWYLGALPQGSYTTHTPNQFYKAERGNKVGTNHLIAYNANIGLMYPSDYGYSIGSNYQNNSIYEKRNEYESLSWLSKGSEWTITHVSDYDHAWYINKTYVNGANVYGVQTGVRPSFYLKEEIRYKNGEGTKENPYRIAIDE